MATVNKIDLVDFDQGRFAEVEAELRRWPPGSVAPNCPSSPSPPSTATTWCTARTTPPGTTGPTLLEYLEGVELSAPQPEAAKLRLPIQWVSRPTTDERRRYTGRLAAGTLSVGDAVVSLPAGTRSTVTAVDTLDDDRTTAVAPLSVSIELADDIDVGRGDVLVSGAENATLPVLARELDATVCWFVETPLRAGDRVALKQTTRTVRATVQALHTRLDPETLDELDNPVELSLNDIGSVTLRTSSIVVADPYTDNRDSGAFILIDETTERHRRRGHHHRAARGQAGRRRPATTSVGTLRHSIATTAGRPPASGAPPSGSPACPHRASRRWPSPSNAHSSSPVTSPICSTATTSGTACPTTSASPPGDRAENIRRVGHLTRLFADAGRGRAGLAGVAAEVRPGDRPRPQRRGQAAVHRGVHLRRRVEECEKRDPKGLYARARAGELKGLTGVDAPVRGARECRPGARHHRRRHRRAGRPRCSRC